MKTKTNLFIVATVGNSLDIDIIGVFSTLKKAEEIRDKIKAEEPVEGLNYDHDDVIVIRHCRLNEIITNMKNPVCKSRLSTHTENADKVINAITETLLRASCEEIEAAAKAAGLNVTYVGDSLFEVAC